MPLLSVQIGHQPDNNPSQHVARELTDLTHRHLHKDPALTAVAITTVSVENWFVGGRSLATQGLNSFSLDIKITAGTNTKAELANYVEAVFRAMGRLLGPLHDTSYVVVHEVAAASWGYAGKTQEYRFVSGRMKAAA